MKRKNDNQIKTNSASSGLIAGGILTIAALAVILVGSRLLDRRINDRAVREDPYRMEEGEALDYENYARGTLSIGDVEFDYFHNFDNYLIMGTDGSGNEEGSGEDFHNGMADFLLVLSIDKTADTYTLIELNRDTVMMVPTLDENDEIKGYQYMQMCTAHWYGSTREAGCLNQVQAVSDFLGGIDFDGYYAISMYDIGKMNHAIGGVTVTLEDDLSKDDPAMKRGATLTLTDQQAEIYLRARMGVGKGLNTERMARQHTYLTAFLDQGMEKLAKTPRYFYDLFENMESFALTNLTGKQLSIIAKALTSNERKGMFSFEGENITGFVLGDGLEHSEYYVEDETLMRELTQVFGLMPKEEYWYDLVMEGINYWGLDPELESEDLQYLLEEESEWESESEYPEEAGSENVGPI